MAAWGHLLPSQLTALTSEVGGEADEVGVKSDIRGWMSAVGGRADVARRWLELPLIAEFVEKVGAGANFWCPLLERADISLPPQFLLRRFGFLGLWR